jgi:hypothetical protein
MRRSSCSAPRAHSSSSRSFRSRDVQERNICIYIYMYILYRLSLTRSNNSTFSSKLRYKPFRTAMPRIKQTSRRGRLYLKSRLEPMSTAINNSINRDPTSFTRDLSPASSVVALSDREEDDCVETKRNEDDQTVDYGNEWLNSPMPSISTHRSFLPQSKGISTHTGLSSSRGSMIPAYVLLPIRSTENSGSPPVTRRETDSPRTPTNKDFPGGFKSTSGIDLDRSHRDSSEEIPLPATLKRSVFEADRYSSEEAPTSAAIKQSAPIDLTGADGTAPLVGKRKRKRQRALRLVDLSFG